MRKYAILSLAVLILFGLATSAAAVQVMKVSANTQPDGTLITVQLDGQAYHQVSFFENKLVIEIDDAQFFFPTQTLDFADQQVDKIKIAQFSKKPDVVRVVVDLVGQPAGPERYKNLSASGQDIIKIQVLPPAKTEAKPMGAAEPSPPAKPTSASPEKPTTVAAQPEKPAPVSLEKPKTVAAQPTKPESASTTVAAPPPAKLPEPVAKVAETIAKISVNEIQVTAGQSTTLDLDRTVTNVAVGDPLIADFVIINPREILVNGKKEGATSLTLWYSQGRTNYRVIVTKVPSYYLTRSFKLSHIKLETTEFANDTVITKTDEAMVGELDRMLSETISKDKYSINTRLGTVTVHGSPGDVAAVESLFKKIDVPRQQLIIECQVLEIKKTVGQEIGLTWIGQAGKTIGSFSTSATNPPKIYSAYPKGPGIDPETGQPGVAVDPATGRPLTMPSAVEAGAVVPKTLPAVTNPFPAIIDDSYDVKMNTPISALGAGGGIIYDSRATAASMLMAQLSALETDNKAKLLANPRLATIDGQTSLILVGQKVPIIQKTVDAVTVQYIDIGVKLAITPRVGANGEILTWLRTEASGIAGYQGDYPLISSREAQAEVRLRDGQTLIIGGLLQKDDTKVDVKVPLLGDLPIVGFLFRGKKDTNTDTEIIITITPRLLGTD